MGRPPEEEDERGLGEGVVARAFQQRHESTQMRNIARGAIRDLRLWRSLRGRVTSCSLRRSRAARGETETPPEQNGSETLTANGENA